ncbi:dihydroneopterin aldolase [Bacillus sp. FJAT-50079]|uniref:dihydroneopterin aldolase n=1 Tax=Bacillus sp. FJAT-50079 TaxID=2833577 RepID=UPI001BC913A6|nr:dihydroneopterin aldolase [Bacillus sp. FJAT-50079]MBS4210825.1 dihydroneopterin aldolase [Bacillus sp. FJAT-50079]
MDKIYLHEMEFYGYHGVLSEETRLGQRFRVSIIAEVDLREAGETDNLEKTVSYADMYEVCKEIVEGHPYKLIEAVAEKIAHTILKEYRKIKRITVKVIKPDPPIPGHYRSVAVEITRENKYE